MSVTVSDGVVEFVHHRVTYRIDAAAGTVSELWPRWKSRSRIWPARSFSEVALVARWYKGCEERLIALRGVDEEGQAFEVVLGLSDADHARAATRAEAIARCLRIPLVQPDGSAADLHAPPVAAWISAPPTFEDGSTPPRAGRRVFRSVGRCEHCEEMACSTPLWEIDERGFWAVAECPACGVRFRYQRQGPHLLSVEADPGSWERRRVVTVRIDHENDYLALGWVPSESSGCRVLDLRRNFSVEVAVPGGGPMSLLAAAEGAVVVVSGRSACDDEEQARLHPVTALHVVDADDGDLLWSIELDHEPLVQVAGGVLRLSWEGTWCLRAVEGRPERYLDLRTGHPSEGGQERFEDARAASAARRTRHFPPIGGAWPGDADFAVGQAIVRRHLGVDPEQRLSVLQHVGYDIVDCHLPVADGPGLQEMLVVAEGERLVMAPVLRNPTVVAADVAANWNLTGFYVEGEWLVVQRSAESVQVLRLG